MLFNLFGGAYSLETDLAFHTELIPVGVQASTRIVWDKIQEELEGPGYSFKDLILILAKEATKCYNEKYPNLNGWFS